MGEDIRHKVEARHYLKQTEISRKKLKQGIYDPDTVQVVRETQLTEQSIEDFYRPAVTLLDRILRERSVS